MGKMSVLPQSDRLGNTRILSLLQGRANCYMAPLVAGQKSAEYEYAKSPLST